MNFPLKLSRQSIQNQVVFSISLFLCCASVIEDENYHPTYAWNPDSPTRGDIWVQILWPGRGQAQEPPRQVLAPLFTGTNLWLTDPQDSIPTSSHCLANESKMHQHGILKQNTWWNLPHTWWQSAKHNIYVIDQRRIILLRDQHILKVIFVIGTVWGGLFFKWLIFF